MIVVIPQNSQPFGTMKRGIYEVNNFSENGIMIYFDSGCLNLFKQIQKYLSENLYFQEIKYDIG